MMAKLVTSTNEYSRSSWHRNHAKAVSSIGSATYATRSRGEFSTRREETDRRGVTSRRLTRVHVSPRTWLVVSSNTRAVR